MQRVEQHVIDTKDTRYGAIDAAAYASKNLYNAALYEIRQAFIQEGTYLNYGEMDKRMQSHEAYKALPSKVAQQMLRLLEKNWKSFFEAVKAYRDTPSKFKARPRLPAYKHKTQGRNALVYTMQAVSRGKRTLQRHIIVPSGLDIQVKTQQDPASLAQVRIVPRKGFMS
jgi:putative transposase